MRNLAGCKDADTVIAEELRRCRIEPRPLDDDERHGEVPATIGGRLGALTFRRAWYYWMVHGDVPLAIAERLYADPIGRADIRVAGHCGCPPPSEWAVAGYVSTYHIDSEAGLRIFADAVRDAATPAEERRPAAGWREALPGYYVLDVTATLTAHVERMANGAAWWVWADGDTKRGRLEGGTLEAAQLAAEDAAARLLVDAVLALGPDAALEVAEAIGEKLRGR